MSDHHEYKFDVSLRAVAIIKAPNEAIAREALEYIDCVDFSEVYIRTGESPAKVTIPEASYDDENPAYPTHLYMVDGKELDE